MSHNLPPSRFTAGTTYGGKDDPRGAPPQNPQWQQPPQYPPPHQQGAIDPRAQTVAAPYGPPSAPYGPPGGYPAQASYASPPPSYVDPQAGYHDPYAGAQLPAQNAGGAGGGGTALTAAVLGCVAGIAHAAWPVPFFLFYADHKDDVFMFFGINGFFKDWEGWWMMGSSAVQVLLGLVLLVGGISLMRRSSGGRSTVAVTSLLLIVLNAVSLGIGVWKAEVSELSFIFNGVFWWFFKFDSIGDMVNFKDSFATQCILWGALMLVSIVAFVLAATPATKRWCDQAGTAPYASSAY